MIVPIESAGDPRVADYRDVKESRLFSARGLFVAEGIEVVRTLIGASPFVPRSVFIAERHLPRLSDLTERRPEIPIFTASVGVLSEVAGFDVHRGCLALGERRQPWSSLDDLAASGRGASILIVLEAIANHDNVGALFRNARGFGVGGVVLDPRCADPLYRKAIRVSMGASLVVPWIRLSDWPTGLDGLASRGYEIAALTPSEDAADLASVALEHRGSLPARIALAFGTEGTGLTPAVLERARVRWRIPMAEGADSLNVAVASGIALFVLQAGAERRTRRS
jgi:tRNA G18 (ribose-2'-O)-methylase SpoU